MKFFKEKISFKFTVKRCILAIILISFLLILGIIVNKIYRYYETPEGQAKMYVLELKRYAELDSKDIIKIEKYDFNRDGIKDYIAIVANSKYSDTTNALEKSVNYYTDLEILFFDKRKNEVLRYNTKKNFGKDVTFKIYEDKDTQYVFVTDTSSGNVSMIKLEDNTLKDIVYDSFGSTFSGYTIDMEFDKEDKLKLNVNLDNYGKADYLPENNENYILDFNNTGIELDKYRQTYNLDRFTGFRLEDLDYDGVFELVTSQYILYLYKEAENIQEHIGSVDITFEYVDGKYIYDKIDVHI